MVWMLVLLTGFAFGISGVRPVPVILAVQAINGLILPLVTLYLIEIVNDRKIVPTEHAHAGWYNIVLLLILGVVLLIGFNNIDKTIGQLIGDPKPHTIIASVATVVIVVYTGFRVFRRVKK
jgi:Mn2+/Fe2+ NRAMP family transporter